MQTDYNWIENPEQSNWNIQDIDAFINQIKNGNLHGGYGKDVSNEMKDIMEEYMIDNVSSVSKRAHRISKILFVLSSLIFLEIRIINGLLCYHLNHVLCTVRLWSF